jgi:hypothetical protein
VMTSSKLSRDRASFVYFSLWREKGKGISLDFDSGSHPNGKYGVSFFSNYSGGFCKW